MPKMFFNSEHCQAATSERTGKKYWADKKGFINVTDPGDAKFFAENGYIAAGGMPKFRKFWLCECGWESDINSCPKCSRNDLMKVEK